MTDYITTIERYAFYNCTNLVKVTIPRSVTSINSTAFSGCPNLVIYCYTGSYAQHYAEDKGIDYVLIDAPAPTEPPTEAPTDAPTEPVTEAPTEAPTAIPTELPTEMPTAAPTQAATEAPTEQNGYYLGDVNNNGYVDILDATFIQRALADFVLPDYCDLSHGDVDGSGDFQIVDATLIGRYLAELRVDYPIGEWIAVS